MDRSGIRRIICSKCPFVNPDTSRETATPLTDGCNNWMVKLSPSD